MWGKGVGEGCRGGVLGRGVAGDKQSLFAQTWVIDSGIIDEHYSVGLHYVAYISKGNYNQD